MWKKLWITTSILSLLFGFVRIQEAKAVEYLITWNGATIDAPLRASVVKNPVTVSFTGISSQTCNQNAVRLRVVNHDQIAKTVSSNWNTISSPGAPSNQSFTITVPFTSNRNHWTIFVDYSANGGSTVCESDVQSPGGIDQWWFTLVNPAINNIPGASTLTGADSFDTIGYSLTPSDGTLDLLNWDHQLIIINICIIVFLGTLFAVNLWSK